MSDSAASRLTQFQLDAAGMFFSLPDSVGFLLAGGGALIAQGIVVRDTDDLDFFTQRGGGDVDAAATALIAAAQAQSWSAEVLRSGPDFRRIALVRRAGSQNVDDEVVYVDLAVDSPPTGTPTVTIAGPTLPPLELAIRKTLALFSRAEPRDFTDVHAIHQHFARHEILAEASRADAGFDASVFVQMLRSHRRLRDEDFPRTTVDVSELRAYFDAWAEELDS